MARTSSRRTNARSNSRNTSNAMQIQRAINEDYVDLVMDYRKLFVALWRKPATKYVLGGIALAALTPTIMRFFRDTNVSEFISEKMDSLHLRDLGEKVSNTISDFKSGPAEEADFHQ